MLRAMMSMDDVDASFGGTLRNFMGLDVRGKCSGTLLHVITGMMGTEQLCRPMHS